MSIINDIMKNIDMILLIKIGVQIVLALIIYSKIKKTTKDFEFLKFKKLILVLTLAIIIAYNLGLGGLSLVLTTLLIGYPISNILAYPQEFRNFLDDFQERKVSKKNVSRLLSSDSLDAVAETIVRCYRQKLGSVIVITREDYLNDIENTGYKMGDTNINSDLMELMFKPNSPLNKGAIIIRDDKIVANNCKLSPIIVKEQLAKAGGGEKHFAMLGVVTTTDAVVIGTSGDSGYITIGGTRPDGSAYFRLLAKMQEHDMQNGLTKDEIKRIIKILLEGVGNPEDYHLEKEKELEKQRMLEEKAHKKLDKAKNVKSKEQKIAERNEKRNKKKNK